MVVVVLLLDGSYGWVLNEVTKSGRISIGIYFRSSRWSYLADMVSILGHGNEWIENQITESDSVSDRVEGRVAV